MKEIYKMNIQPIGNQNNNKKMSFGMLSTSRNVNKALNVLAKDPECSEWAKSLKSAIKTAKENQKWDKSNKFILYLFGYMEPNTVALTFDHKVKVKGKIFSHWENEKFVDTIHVDAKKIPEGIQDYVQSNRKSSLVEYKAD